MEATQILGLVLAAAVAAPAGVVAADAAGYLPQDHGLCTAWPNVQDAGNATEADAFVNLSERADANNRTVEEHCDEVPHPGQRGLDRADEARDGAGADAADAADDDRRGPPDGVPPSHARGR